jgi:GR25 family glycosyltransferase involved in LPS biosynthesis
MQSHYQNIFKHFDEIYLINLDTRPDRLAKTREEFARVGIEKFARVLGVVHENPAIGCHLSHASAFSDAIKHGYDNILIFEDDVEFFPEGVENLQKAYEELPIDWQMFYLGANLDQYPAYKVSEHICKLTGAFATHAYAVNRTLFSTLYDINASLETVHNDVWYATLIHPNYNCYLTMPLVAGQRNDFSDIQGRVVASNEMFKARLERNLVR